MSRSIFVCAAAVLIAITGPISAQDLEGNWKLSYVTNGNFEQTLAIVGLKKDDGKLTGSLLAQRFLKPAFKSVRLAKDLLHLELESGDIQLSFEGVLNKDDPKKLLGSLAIDGKPYAGWLTATEDATLPKISVRTLACPPLQQQRTLEAKANKLKFAALNATDADKKAELLKQYEEADAALKKETPKLLREVVQNHADIPAIFDAGLILIRSAKKLDARAFDMPALAKTIADAARPYGPRWQLHVDAELASALLSQDAQAGLALDYAKKAERGLGDKTPAAEQVRTLNIVSRALRKNAKSEDAVKLDERIEKLEQVLDHDYHAKFPGFKGETFAGRKSKSERTAFMELFTGAMCPPCVAADLAFDVLQKSYKPSELVLIQYHMHIPAPDPLTNADTEARWAYYRAAYPGKVGGVPSSLFNGQPKASGGGGAANAEQKYDAYRKVIDSLLEEETPVKLIAKAERRGDKIDIHVRVSGLADPGTEKKLRVVLAEESIRYLGSNKIRFHHNVVRAFPGGVEGKSLTEAASRHNLSINVADLRHQLTRYLDDFEGTGKSFANPSRPLAMTQLRIIAFVQDDMSHEILQVVQTEVEGK